MGYRNLQFLHEVIENRLRQLKPTMKPTMLCAQVAKEYAVSPKFVRNRGIIAGILTRQVRGPRPRKLSPEDRVRIKAYLREGADLRVLAQTFNIAYGTVHYYYKQVEREMRDAS